MHLLYLVLLLLASISNSILLFIIRKQLLHSLTLGTFGILLVLINIWAIPQLILVTFPIQGDLFIAIDKISAFGYVFIPVAFALFSLAYTDNMQIAKTFRFLFFVCAPSLIFLYLAWNTNLIESHIFSQITETHWGYTVPTGPFFPIMALWFETITITYIILMYRSHKRTLDTNKRKQSMLLIVALIIPWIFGTVTNALLPILHIVSFPLAMPLTSLTAILIVYAIYKYGLFEMSSSTILSNIGNGVISVNRNKQIVQINNAAKKMLGLQAANTLGKPFHDVIVLRSSSYSHKQHGPKYPLQHVLTTGNKILSRHFTLITKNKKSFSIECSISPIIESTTITGATLVFRDMTKEMEIEKSKNEFISIASHELKTPLTSAIAYGQLLEKIIRNRKIPKEMSLVTSMNTQLQNMKSLIEDLLNVSKIESGIFILNKKVYSIDLLIHKTCKEFQTIQSTHNIIQQGQSKQKLLIDVERIQQVLSNLIANAIKYSPKANRIIVHVRDDTDGVIISIEDFGIGIPKNEQAKIFDRFYRTKHSRTSAIGGFGLGLYICATITKNHGGNIWVESALGKGSTFSIFLPTQG